MAKYSLETKLAAVHAYLSGVESFKTVAEKYSVNISMLKKWVARFREHGLEGFPKAYTNYSIEFKMDVLNYMNETGASISETTTVFNIPGSNTVWEWKNLFDTQGIDTLQSKKKGRPSVNNKKENNHLVEGSEETLQAEVERLRMENVYLKKLHALIQEKEKSPRKTKRK